MSDSTTIPEIRRSQFYRAPLAKVWAAVSTAEGLAAWFMPNDLAPVVGHKFHLNAGPWGNSPCEVTAVEPPHRLSFRWGKDWEVTFELRERDGGTELTLNHAGWDPEQVTEFGESHRIVRDRMDGGWAGLLNKLGEQLAA